MLVIYPTNQAVIALTFSNYVLQPLFPTCFPPESGLRLLAGVCLCKCRFLPLCLCYGERNFLTYGAQGLFQSLRVETCINVDMPKFFCQHFQVNISCCSLRMNVKVAVTGGGLNLNWRNSSSGIGKQDKNLCTS